MNRLCMWKAWGRKCHPGSREKTQRHQSVSSGVIPGEWAAPGGHLLVTSVAFLGARVPPAELVLLLPGYTLFWKASTHLPSALDKSFLRNPWVRKD